MYRVLNVSLDPIYVQFKVSSLEDLTDDDLIKASEIAGSSAVWRRGESGKRASFDRLQTIERVMLDNTVDMYMGDPYWEERHIKMASGSDLYKRMGAVKTGTETFRLMAQVKLGVHRLRPGQAQDVDWTERFIREVIKDTPLLNAKRPMIEVTDLKVGKKVTFKASEPLAGVPKTTEGLKGASYPRLKELAKEKGISWVGKPKMALIEELVLAYEG